MNKAEFRKLALRQRNEQPDKDGISQQIRRKLSQLFVFKNASSILFYVDVRAEVRTTPLLQKALSTGKSIGVPFCAGELLQLFQLQNFDELETQSFGILEPNEQVRSENNREKNFTDFDLALIPGVAFGRDGSRLGNGHGYYDRLLATHGDHRRFGRPILVGLAYESQTFDTIPMDDHDIRVDLIVTEKSIYGPIEKFR